MVGPRGFEPRVSGSEGLRPVGNVRSGRRLNPSWATGPRNSKGGASKEAFPLHPTQLFFSRIQVFLRKTLIRYAYVYFKKETFCP